MNSVSSRSVLNFVLCVPFQRTCLCVPVADVEVMLGVDADGGRRLSRASPTVVRLLNFVLLNQQWRRVRMNRARSSGAPAPRQSFITVPTVSASLGLTVI